MSRRNGGRSNVKGPNSALTEFLRVEGITDAFRRRREQELDEAIDIIGDNTLESVPVSSNTDSPVIGGSGLNPEPIGDSEDEEVAEIRMAARRKRNESRGTDSDDYYSDDSLEDEYKQSGDRETCAACEKGFKLTVYSRYDATRKGYLCEECAEEQKIRDKLNRKNQQNARRKRKKVAQALLDKSKVHIPSLQDVCIKRITSNIDQVEALGDIGAVNMSKILRILSKNRSLNNQTMSLFLSPELKSLEFWDCSNVDSDSLNKIASYCPQIESLTLYMCGHLHNDNFEYFSDKLQKLTELNLNGPFLISDTAWQDFFETGGKRLTKFEVRNTHRFGNDALISLLENCGKQLTALRLSRLDGIDSAEVYELIPHYLTASSLTHLEISYPKSEELVSDELLLNILAITGGTLVSLNVDGYTALTNDFVNEGLSCFCKSLTHLSMRNLDQFTDEADFGPFGEISGGLISLDLTKCEGISEQGVYQLLKHSCSTLVELSLNSLSLSKNFLWQILTDDFDDTKKTFRENNADTNSAYYLGLTFPLLTTLNIGFVRAVDNQILGLLSKKCPKLKILEVFDNNKCTVEANTREDLIIIGRQSDSI